MNGSHGDLGMFHRAPKDRKGKSLLLVPMVRAAWAQDPAPTRGH